MSFKFFAVRIPLTLLGSIALVLATSRCSPLSLSQSKLKSATPASGANPGILGNPLEVAPAGGTASTNPGVPAAAVALSGVPASVHDVASYQTEIGTQPSEQRLSLSSEENAEALEILKSDRAITLRFDGRAPDSCKAYLGLSLSETEIANFGWSNSVNPVTTDCVQQTNGDWRFSISATVSQDTWNLIFPNLRAVTISIASRRHMRVVLPAGTHPSPLLRQGRLLRPTSPLPATPVPTAQPDA